MKLKLSLELKSLAMRLCMAVTYDTDLMKYDTDLNLNNQEIWNATGTVAPARDYYLSHGTVLCSTSQELLRLFHSSSKRNCLHAPTFSRVAILLVPCDACCFSPCPVCT